VSDRLGLHDLNGPGFVDAILNPDLDLDEVVTRRPLFNLAVLPAGHPPSAPYEVLVIDEVILAVPRSLIADVEKVARACEEEGVRISFMATCST
jgi:hypothetical protein